MSRILLVEDEEHLAAGIRFNLELDGYEVETIGDGLAALQRLAPEAAGPVPPAPVDLVLLDVMLPGMDGFRIVERMRRAGNYVPVLMLTAKGRPEDLVEGLERGADDYLPKPFDLPVLLAR
ncbi:MAG TPA: response regulator, partial [Vicinamibacteria bacterium]|nr:response regulator [Vicinamibacteria bacterium]